MTQSGPASDPGALASEYFHSYAAPTAPRSAASVASRGLRVDAFCSKDCEGRIRLLLGRGDAKRAGVPRVLAVRSIRLAAGYGRSIALRPSSAVGAKLAAAGVDADAFGTRATFRRVG